MSGYTVYSVLNKEEVAVLVNEVECGASQSLYHTQLHSYPTILADLPEGRGVHCENSAVHQCV